MEQDRLNKKKRRPAVCWRRHFGFVSRPKRKQKSIAPSGTTNLTVSMAAAAAAGRWQPETPSPPDGPRRWPSVGGGWWVVGGGEGACSLVDAITSARNVCTKTRRPVPC